MAKPGAGKRKMQAERKRRQRATDKSLKEFGRIFKTKKHKKGCYVASCVYGSYDCPQVWTLRRYRDEYLERSIAGRVFIRIYYTLSPIIVAMFGKNAIVRDIWKKLLDSFVNRLRNRGYSNRRYND